MELFEGKKGPRIYKRRKDAEFVAERKAKAEESQVRIFEIRISKEGKTKNMGASVHPDLSVAARKPERGENGWIVVRDSDELEKKHGRFFEILSKHVID